MDFRENFNTKPSTEKCPHGNIKYCELCQFNKIKTETNYCQHNNKLNQCEFCKTEKTEGKDSCPHGNKDNCDLCKFNKTVKNDR